MASGSLWYCQGNPVIPLDLGWVHVALCGFFNPEDAEIVAQQDDGVYTIISHGSDLICGELVAAISLDGITRREGSASRATPKIASSCPTDTTPKGGMLELGSVREQHCRRSDVTDPRIRDYYVARRDELF